jgi:hypothetical protein
MAGIIAVLTLVLGLPGSVYVPAATPWGDGWYIAFASLFTGIGFAGVARTGCLFCLRKSHTPINH